MSGSPLRSAVCAMLLVSWATYASAGSLTLGWDPNTESDIAGYAVAYGTQSGSYSKTIDVGNRTTVEVSGLIDGERYYFVVFAYDRDGEISPPSAEVVGLAPGEGTPGGPLPACTYDVSVTSILFGAGGGTRSIDVDAPPECDWTAVVSVPWLTVMEGSSGVGPGAFTVAAAAKQAPGLRTATIVVGAASAAIVLVNQGRRTEALPHPPRRDIESVTPGEGQQNNQLTEALALLSSGDYDGDGIVDDSRWSADTGVWTVLTSSSLFASLLQVRWGDGIRGDVPVPADYDGDRRTDIAVWRPDSGIWYVLTSSSGYETYFTVQWGSGSAGDQPIPGDYDGDGRADVAVWRAPDGSGHILRSFLNYSIAYPFVVRSGEGSPGDRAVSGDFDRDGAADIAVWRHAPAVWRVRLSGRGFAEVNAAAP
jgi:hypothetical protein